MWDTAARRGSEASRRSRMPVVQKSSRVSRDVAASRRTWYLARQNERHCCRDEFITGLATGLRTELLCLGPGQMGTDKVHRNIIQATDLVIGQI